MPQRGYRGVAGAPVQPYINYTVNAASTVFLNLQFLDRLNNPAIPASVTYRIDCLTTDYVVLETTLVVPSPTSSALMLTIPGPLNTIGGGPNSNDIGQNSQNNQVLVTATYGDGSTRTEVFVYEVIALQTVGGM